MNRIPVGVFVSVNIPNIKHWRLITGISGGWQDWKRMTTQSFEIVLWIGLIWFHTYESIFFCHGCLFCLFSSRWSPELIISRCYRFILLLKGWIWDVSNLWSPSLITISNILWGCSAHQPKVDIRREMEMIVTACLTGSVVLVAAPEACDRF